MRRNQRFATSRRDFAGEEQDHHQERGGQLREGAEQKTDPQEQVRLQVQPVLPVAKQAGEKDRHGQEREVVVIQAGADIGNHRQGGDREGVKRVLV